MKHAQGSSEYLVLLGAVLVIGLLVVAILSFFPGTSQDSTQTQSWIYWRTMAYPIRIIDAEWQQASIASCTSLSPAGAYNMQYRIVVKNAGETPVTITAISINGNQRHFCEPPYGGVEGSITIDQNEQKTIGIETSGLLSTYSCNPGQFVSDSFRFNYSTPHLAGQAETGSKNLIFKCL